MELELALAQQAEAEARKGRQAAEANSEQLRVELAKARASVRTWRTIHGDHTSDSTWRTVVGAITALGVMVAVLDWWQKRPETIANNAAIEQV